MPLSEEQIRWFRLRRSGLVTPFDSPESAARDVVGVQAQILSAAMLALWNRAEGASTEEELSERLFEQRTLVRLWGQRHTLHLYATLDWPTIHAAFAGRRTWWDRQAERDPALDLTAFREGVARVGRLLRERGTLGRKDLRASGLLLPEALLSPWGGVFAELVRTGAACHARWHGGEARYAHREHWLPGFAWSPPAAEEANLALARRYFRCFGPAAVPDLAYWRGATSKDARRWVAAFSKEMAEVEADTPEGRRTLLAFRSDLPALNEAPPAREEWPLRLLGRFDPLLLGHRNKDWIVPAAAYNCVWRPAGHIEAIVLEHGLAVATWRYTRVGAGRLAVRAFPFRSPLAAWIAKEVRRQARELARFFGLKLAEVRVERASAVRRG